MKKYRNVLTYGTFDLFHVGHVRLLRRLSEISDNLIVGVSTDQFNFSKGKKSFYSFEERVEILRSCSFVTDVIPENTWEQKVDDVAKYSIDMFAMGHDWEGKFDYLKQYCDVLYLPRTEDISTTEIKRKLASLNIDKIDEVETSLLSVLEIIKSFNTGSA